MIERYTMPEMKKVWAVKNRFELMLQIELYACEAARDKGDITAEIYDEIKANAHFDLQRIVEIEEVTRHDVVAFLAAVGENLGDLAKYVHKGLTASDILDTALSVQMKQSAELLLGNLYVLRDILVEKAKKYKYTLMVGRTHGMHAEPTTFGLKMALWIKETDRCIERITSAKNTIAVGKMSGAVGNFANIDPFIEEHVCRRLGLKPEEVSTQIIQRDRHAYFINMLALVGSTIEKFATEIRNLSRTDISEVDEPYTKGQRDSMGMPHKRNPVVTERLTGLSRILRGNALAAMEDISLWHERDMTHSSVERIIIPDSCMLLDYMLDHMANVMRDLIVHADNMLANMEKTLGLLSSQRVFLALMDHGVARETAYEWVKRNALGAFENKMDFEYYILQDKDIMRIMSSEELDTLFDYDYCIKNVDYIFTRAGIE
ncbi:MAG: adenylosuccinate lyase [Clostridia bacterium]|nr:adenylosuccinate lyase [Clostridia bacterium]